MKVLNFVKLCFCSPYISGRFWWHRCQQKSTEWDQKTKFQQNSTPPSSTEAEEIQKFAGRDPAKCSKVKKDKSSKGICKEMYSLLAVNIDLSSPFYFYDTFSIVMLALVQRPITSIASKKVKRFLLRISRINDCSAWAYTLSFFNRLTYFLGLTVQCFLSHLKRKLRVRLFGELVVNWL